jgi:Uma2 family endonuclease
LFYLAEETERRLEPSHRITADLVIEVISPGSAIYDRNTKADTYAALGVRELWLVDEVSQTVEIRSLVGQRFGAGVIFAAEQPLVSTVLPGLTFGVARIFTE